MRITIQVNGHLRRTSSLGSQKQEYDTGHGSTIRDILGGLNISEWDIRKVVCNGKKVRLDTRLRARDELELY